MLRPEAAFELYARAWNDPERAKAFLEECWAEDGVYADATWTQEGGDPPESLSGADVIEFAADGRIARVTNVLTTS